MVMDDGGCYLIWTLTLTLLPIPTTMMIPTTIPMMVKMMQIGIGGGDIKKNNKVSSSLMIPSSGSSTWKATSTTASKHTALAWCHPNNNRNRTSNRIQTNVWSSKQKQQTSNPMPASHIN
jgi:predicted metal-binding membrane protein